MLLRKTVEAQFYLGGILTG